MVVVAWLVWGHFHNYRLFTNGSSTPSVASDTSFNSGCQYISSDKRTTTIHYWWRLAVFLRNSNITMNPECSSIFRYIHKRLNLTFSTGDAGYKSVTKYLHGTALSVFLPTQQGLLHCYRLCGINGHWLGHLFAPFRSSSFFRFWATLSCRGYLFCKNARKFLNSPYCSLSCWCS